MGARLNLALNGLQGERSDSQDMRAMCRTILFIMKVVARKLEHTPCAP